MSTDRPSGIALMNQAQATLVQKFGGSSLATPEHIQRVAERIAQEHHRGARLVVVVSAMGETTDHLVALANQVSGKPGPREMDALLAAGEAITAPLMAMAVESEGVPSLSLSGAQAGIRTSPSHTRARILDVLPTRVIQALDEGKVVVVAGFQGVDEVLDVTTLGRGGSDTTAVALAAALKAEECEIYSDVDGVYSADPRVVAQAQLLASISYQEMLELSSVGARVLHPRSVEIAELYNMPIRVRNSFNTRPGTLITREAKVENRNRVRGVAVEEDVVKITVVGVSDRPGIAAALFTPLASAGISVDLIIQNVSRGGITDISFTVHADDALEAERLVRETSRSIAVQDVLTNSNLAKISIIGTGIRSQPEIPARMFQALSDAHVNIEMISASEIRITCIVDKEKANQAANVLHRVFELEEPASQGQ